MLALVPVRSGTLPNGALEAIAECRGRVAVVGDGAAAAAKELAGRAREVTAWEVPGFRPAAWAAALAREPALMAESVIVLPGSADGRDLAPRLAHALHRPLLAGAIEVRPDRVSLARWGGLAIEDVDPPLRFVVTLLPGQRGTEAADDSEPSISELRLDLESDGTPIASDAEHLEELPPDVSTIDLTEAGRILGGGAGLDSAARFVQLAEVAAALGASMGATRVVTDRGWVGHERQIGTTGVVVDPQLYLAFAISGAVQHTSGLGQPDHVVSVNVDAHCPMMQLADLAVVADANAVLDELAVRLGLPEPPSRRWPGGEGGPGA